MNWSLGQGGGGRFICLAVPRLACYIYTTVLKQVSCLVSQFKNTMVISLERHLVSQIWFHFKKKNLPHLCSSNEIITFRNMVLCSQKIPAIDYFRIIIFSVYCKFYNSEIQEWNYKVILNWSFTCFVFIQISICYLKLEEPHGRSCTKVLQLCRLVPRSTFQRFLWEQQDGKLVFVLLVMGKHWIIQVDFV